MMKKMGNSSSSFGSGYDADDEKALEEEEELSDEYVMEGVESNEPAEIDKLTPG